MRKYFKDPMLKNFQLHAEVGFFTLMFCRRGFSGSTVMYIHCAFTDGKRRECTEGNGANLRKIKGESYRKL